MVESERTRVLYRRVNMFYIPLLSVIHWRAATPSPGAHRYPTKRVASLSEMPSFNKTYIFPSKENTGETRNLFFHFMLVYKTKVEHFRNIMLIRQLCQFIIIEPRYLQFMRAQVNQNNIIAGEFHPVSANSVGLKRQQQVREVIKCVMGGFIRG